MDTFYRHSLAKIAPSKLKAIANGNYFRKPPLTAGKYLQNNMINCLRIVSFVCIMHDIICLFNYDIICLFNA